MKPLRAIYDADTIRVYQAYSDQIADIALAAGRFVSPHFSMTRMTWIKPSFLWMMYRAGWGYKDDKQCRSLAIDMSHGGFNWALEQSCPSRPVALMTKEVWTKLKAVCPVRVQWDPERDLRLQPLAHRAIRIGIGGDAMRLYVNQWVQTITDVTDLAHAIHGLVEAGDLAQAKAMIPKERDYTAIGN